MLTRLRPAGRVVVVAVVVFLSRKAREQRLAADWPANVGSDDSRARGPGEVAGGGCQLPAGRLNPRYSPRDSTGPTALAQGR